MDKNEFGLFLKEYMEKHEYKLEAFADKVGYSFSLIGHYINGRRSPSYKFVNAFFTKFRLSEEEKIKVLNILKKDKLPEEIQALERKIENYSDDERVQNLTAKELNQYEAALSQASSFFGDERVSEEDKKKLLDAMTEMFFIGKAKNKEKYAKNKADKK